MVSHKKCFYVLVNLFTYQVITQIYPQIRISDGLRAQCVAVYWKHRASQATKSCTTPPHPITKDALEKVREEKLPTFCWILEILRIHICRGMGNQGSMCNVACLQQLYTFTLSCLIWKESFHIGPHSFAPIYHNTMTAQKVYLSECGFKYQELLVLVVISGEMTNMAKGHKYY